MNYFASLLFLLTSIFVNAQIEEFNLSTNQENELNETFKNYLSDIQAPDKDWNQITSYTHAKLFDLLSKDDMINKLKVSFKNEAYYTTYEVMDYLNEESSFKFNEVMYSKVLYNTRFTFHFTQGENDTDKEFNLYVDFMAGTFQNKFKDMQVAKQEGNNIVFSGVKTIIAVMDPSVGSWKMLEYLENNEMYYSLFLPKEVAAKLGE